MYDILILVHLYSSIPTYPMPPRRLLPKPSTDSTHKLSTQCDYRPSDPPKARRHALATCLDNHTFAYASLVRRLNLIRNLQGPKLDEYRAIYTADLEWLKKYVAQARNTRHDPRAYMLTAKEQRRHVEVLVPVALDDAHPTPETVVAAVQQRWRRPAARTQVRLCKDPARYTSYPYHLYVRGPKATTLKARKRRAKRPSQRAAAAKGTTRRRAPLGPECTVHLYLEVPKGVNEAKLRRRVRTRVQSVGVAVRGEGVRVLKFPSGGFGG